MNLSKTRASGPRDWRLDARTKVSASWASLMMCLYVEAIGFFDPGRLAAFAPGALLAVAILITVPAIMAFLTLVLTPGASRAANIGLGAVVAIVVMIAIPDASTFHVLLGIVEMALAASVVWQAWNWPRPGPG